eukprot:GAFH01005126.1.p1 GENE.GAFH01005126.1~~GAFH01005126.1.p1  ORF type:complete len:184 (+),score=17.92 GAFH01005126.1:3-554(+)
MSQATSSQWPRSASLIERYFKTYYLADAGGVPYQDIYLHAHSNGLIIVGITKNHPIFSRIAQGATITKVDFDIGRQDRSKHRVHGRFKKGGLQLSPDTVICMITTSDGMGYKVVSGCRGSLLEVNHRLQEDPTLLTRKPETEGFIAIINPRDVAQDYAALTLAQYEARCADRVARGVPVPPGS